MNWRLSALNFETKMKIVPYVEIPMPFIGIEL